MPNPPSRRAVLACALVMLATTARAQEHVTGSEVVPAGHESVRNEPRPWHGRIHARASFFRNAHHHTMSIFSTIQDGQKNRHAGDYRPRAWCGWWLRQQLGVADRRFNLAREWTRYGRPAGGPHVGAIVVWRHHVGRIVGPCNGAVCLIQSGNDGHAVRTRERSVAGAIAFRVPG